VTDTLGGSEPDPDFEAQFARLVREVEQGRAAPVHEPSARARMLQSKWREEPPATAPWRGDVPTLGDETARKTQHTGRQRGGRRNWPRNAVIAVIVGALVLAVVETELQDRSHAAAADAPRVASTSTAGTATSTPSAAGTATSPSSAAAAVAADALIPVAQLFPATVHGANGTTYTLVQSGDLADCVKTDMVAPTLAGLFGQSKGCVGGEGALYKDAAKDQFNIVVFTLKDPSDVVQILSDLSMNLSDFEVATLAPPAGSGLTALPATSGIIQQFAGSGHRLGVFMAQWSDGRAADYADLQTLLTPLQNVVGQTLTADG
jgi:hypothetical protein